LNSLEYVCRFRCCPVLSGGETDATYRIISIMNQLEINRLANEIATRNVLTAIIENAYESECQIAIQRFSDRHAQRAAMRGNIADSLRAEFRQRVRAMASGYLTNAASRV
jgi:hypothetical protein